MTRARTLSGLIRALIRHHGPPPRPVSRDPFQLVLFTQVAYLVPDAQRRAAFLRLKREVGVTPQEIAAAPARTLLAIARAGGPIGAALRATRMRRSAELALEAWGGRLATTLALPLPRARAALTRFPMVGRPGADRILATTGAYPTLGLDSHGVRVLLRLGVGTVRRGYAATYAAVQDAAEAALPADPGFLADAVGVLRTHGQTLCGDRTPLCDACPLRIPCPSAGHGAVKP